MSSRPIDLLRDLAERARRRLFLASHIVLDDEVPRILGRARERGVSVRLFTEIADRANGGLRINTLVLDGQYTGEELARHDALIRLLAHDGVQIQSSRGHRVGQPDDEFPRHGPVARGRTGAAM